MNFAWNTAATTINAVPKNFDLDLFRKKNGLMDSLMAKPDKHASIALIHITIWVGTLGSTNQVAMIWHKSKTPLHMHGVFFDTTKNICNNLNEGPGMGFNQQTKPTNWQKEIRMNKLNVAGDSPPQW